MIKKRVKAESNKKKYHSENIKILEILYSKERGKNGKKRWNRRLDSEHDRGFL